MTNNNNSKPDSFILCYMAVLQDALFRVHRNVCISVGKLALVCFLELQALTVSMFRTIENFTWTGVLLIVLLRADKDHYFFFGQKIVDRGTQKDLIVWRKKPLLLFLLSAWDSLSLMFGSISSEIYRTEDDSWPPTSSGSWPQKLLKKKGERKKKRLL